MQLARPMGSTKCLNFSIIKNLPLEIFLMCNSRNGSGLKTKPYDFRNLNAMYVVSFFFIHHRLPPKTRLYGFVFWLAPLQLCYLDLCYFLYLHSMQLSKLQFRINEQLSLARRDGSAVFNFGEWHYPIFKTWLLPLNNFSKICYHH